MVKEKEKVKGGFMVKKEICSGRFLMLSKLKSWINLRKDFIKKLFQRRV